MLRYRGRERDAEVGEPSNRRSKVGESAPRRVCATTRRLRMRATIERCPKSLASCGKERSRTIRSVLRWSGSSPARAEKICRRRAKLTVTSQNSAERASVQRAGAVGGAGSSANRLASDRGCGYFAGRENVCEYMPIQTSSDERHDAYHSRRFSSGMCVLLVAEFAEETLCTSTACSRRKGSRRFRRGLPT